MHQAPRSYLPRRRTPLRKHCEFTVPVSSDPDDPFRPLYEEGVVVDPHFAHDEVWGLPAVPAQAPAPKLRVPKRRVREWTYEHRLALMNIAWAFVFGIMFGGFVLAAKAGVTPNAITPVILRPDKVQTAPVQPKSSDGPIHHNTDRSDTVTSNGHSATPLKPSAKATTLSSPSASTTSSPSASASSSTSASASPKVSDTPDAAAATTPPSEPTPSASETSTTSTTSAPAEPEAPETPVSPSTAATPAVGVDEASSPSPS